MMNKHLLGASILAACLSLGMAASQEALAADASDAAQAQSSASGEADQTLGGVPMKHLDAFKALGEAPECKTCHVEAVPTERPSDKACIGCHGTMDNIKTKPNRFEKFPHQSAHYGDTLECTTCHAEHKPSKALCNDCHVVEWTNFK